MALKCHINVISILAWLVLVLSNLSEGSSTIRYSRFGPGNLDTRNKLLLFVDIYYKANGLIRVLGMLRGALFDWHFFL